MNEFANLTRIDRFDRPYESQPALRMEILTFPGTRIAVEPNCTGKPPLGSRKHTGRDVVVVTAIQTGQD